MAAAVTWGRLPAEIQLLLLNGFLQIGTKFSNLATVSREWQNFFERHNFARLKLTPSCLKEVPSKIRRNKHLVNYIWFCVELEEYHLACHPVMDNPGASAEVLCVHDVCLVEEAIWDLFAILSTWNPTPTAKLLLDISVYSPTDLEYRFRESTFRPDIPNQCDLYHGPNRPLWKMFENQPNLHRSICPEIKSSFGVMGFGECLREDKQSESQWWQEQPLVPAITGILLRQQTRRQWSPFTLAQMITRLPRLQEFHCETWRDWVPGNGPLFTKEDFEALFSSSASKDLKKLIFFENFHPGLVFTLAPDGDTKTLIRTASRMAARASLGLEHFSGSFLIDATHFFASCKSYWKWKSLKSLTVTSARFTADEERCVIAGMLRAAAAVVMNMPQLETLEIWNGHSKSAALFRYQANRGQMNAALTWRSTWEMLIGPSVMDAWTAVAYEHGARGLHLHKEFLDVRDEVKFYGDAIHYLRLSQMVIRPVSLEQIRQEQEVRVKMTELRRNMPAYRMAEMEACFEPDDSEAQEKLARLRVVRT